MTNVMMWSELKQKLLIYGIIQGRMVYG